MRIVATAGIRPASKVGRLYRQLMPEMEAAIDRALDSVSPSEMQQLAEGYAELMWPERYRHLVPQGRNAFNATTSGWPDAMAMADADGKIHAVEATNGAWSTHLDEDINKAKDKPLASFLFVCRSNVPALSAVAPHRKKLVALGLDESDVTLVFRQDLVRALAGPRFARLRENVLRLPASPAPFVSFEHARDLFSDETPGAFVPSRAEYATPNRVWRNAAAGSVRQRMADLRYAFIEGDGAAGKTVLCTVLALEWMTTRRPAYYLDLSRLADADGGRAIQSMVRYGGDDVMFVVDNAHTAELITGEIFDSWEARADGSVLLISSRAVSSEPWRGVGDRLHDLRADAVHVRATGEDVLGTYRRLVARAGEKPENPSRFLTRRWAQLFRGDLVAFAAALSANQQSHGFPDLSPEDAVDFVRWQYLQRFDARESATSALTTVAALGVLEIAAPVTVADLGALAPWLADGVLLRVGRAITVIHAGLARLLLTALERPPFDIETLARCASNDAGLARSVSRRLSERATALEHQTFWSALVDADNWAPLVSESLTEFPAVARSLQRAHGSSWESVDAVLSDQIEWSSASGGTSPRRLVPVIGLCGQHLPTCLQHLEHVLVCEGRLTPWLAASLEEASARTRGNLESVMRRFCKSLDTEVDVAALPPGTVAAVVSLIRTGGLAGRGKVQILDLLELGPKVVGELDQLLGGMSAEEWLNIICNSTPRIIRRLQRKDLPRTCRKIDEALTSLDVVDAWIEASLVRGADRFASRMFDLRNELPRLHATVGERLGHIGDAERWAERALSRGEAHFGTSDQVGRAFGQALALSISIHSSGRPFIERADAALVRRDRADLLHTAVRVQTAEALGRMVRVTPLAWPRVDTRLVALATDASVTDALARELCNAPLSGLRLVLVRHPLAKAVVERVRLDYFCAGRAVIDAANSYRHFPAVAAGLSALGRRDLAESLAYPLARAVVEGRLSQSRISLAHASHLLRLLPTADSRLRSELAETLGEPGWVATSIDALPAVDLAQSLYSLWLYGQELSARLEPQTLRDHLEAELAHDRRDGIVRLIGATSLYDSRDLPTPRWADELSVDGLLDNRAWEGSPLRAGLAQTLLGMRVMTSARVTPTQQQAARLIGWCQAGPGAPARARELASDLRSWLGVFAGR